MSSFFAIILTERDGDDASATLISTHAMVAWHFELRLACNDSGYHALQSIADGRLTRHASIRL